MKILIKDLLQNRTCEVRESLNNAALQEYASILDKLPKPTVYKVNGEIILACGWHRVNAAMAAGRNSVDVIIKHGGIDDALEDALRDNTKHGVRMTNADKRVAVTKALHQWPDKSDRAIAALCGVSHTSVQNIRSDVAKLATSPGTTAPQPDATEPTRRTGRDGKSYPVEQIRRTDDEIKSPKHITVEQWAELSEEDKSDLLYVKPAYKAQFNYQDNDNIEWARYSWNPVTGCLHNCEYCYARDIANRFYEQKFEPSFIPERLSAPANTKQKSGFADAIDNMGHRNVFTCSMADLFGKWVPVEWIESVLEQAFANPQWNFLFLSKFPIRMADFEFPKNAWVGTSVDNQHAVSRAEKAFNKIKCDGVKWLSCEPMMERLTFKSLSMFDWVVIGGASKSTQTDEFRPPFEWITHLHEQANKAGSKVYEKTNLIRERVRQYPLLNQ